MKETIKRIIYAMNNAIIKGKEKSSLFTIISIPYEKLLRRWYHQIYRRQVLKIEKEKLIYIPIPKAAQSSTKQMAKTIGKIKMVKNYNPKKYFIFTFVRNPYDRLVSCYEDKINREKNRLQDQKFDNFLSKHPEMKKKRNISFKEFVKIVHKIPDYRADQHIRSQISYIVDNKGGIIPNFIGKIETFDEDLKELSKKAKIKKIKKQHKNKSKRKKDYKDYYDEETKRLVQERYKKDFELLGYEL